MDAITDRSHVHKLDALGSHNREVCVEAGLHFVPDESAVVVERRVSFGLSSCPPRFRPSDDRIIVVEVYLSAFHLAVGSLDETEVVDFGIYAQARYKADVRAFRSLDGTKAP